MPTKTIKFRSGQDSSALTTVLDGTNGIVLATGTGAGTYTSAPVLNDIRAGWVPNNDLAIGATGVLGQASPFEFATVGVSPGSGARQLRVDRPAGAFTVKLQTYLPAGGTYASTAIRLLNSDGAELFAQPVANRDTDGIGARQINTDGGMVAVGTADAGVSITTTGAFFVVELPGIGAFTNRLTVVQWDAPDPTPLVANALRFVSTPDPIVPGTPYTLQVEAIDTTQGNARVTSFTNAVTIGIDISLPVGYVIESGTLTRTAVAGLATFPGIIFSTGGGGEPPPPPAPLPPGDGAGPRPDMDRNAQRMQMRGKLNEVLKILAKNAPKRPR